MRVSDLKDFAEYSVINIVFENLFPEALKTDDFVIVALDSVSQKYYLELNGRRYDIKPESTEDKIEMESYIAVPGLFLKCYICNIDSSKRTSHIYIYRFCQHFSMTAQGKLQIKVPDSIMSKLPKKVDNVVSYMSNLFVFNNHKGYQEIFAIKKSRQSEEDDFVLICGKRRLNIKRLGNEYVVTNIVRYNKSDAPMIVMSGNIEFVDDTQSARINEAVADCVSSATSEGKYTAIWRKYDDLESILCVRNAIGSGVYHYKSYTTRQTDVITYIFDLKTKDLIDTLDSGIDLDVTDNQDIMTFYNEKSLDAEKASSLINTIRGKFVGRFVKFLDGKIYIESDSDYTPKKLPTSGYIYRSLQGDIKRIRRRDKAQKIINSEQSALPGLAVLLNDGVSIQKSYSDYAPITEHVIRYLTDNSGKKIDFNEAQRNAIKIAINTPDIALIQGPPGTGKTTVIRAIVARYEEIYKKNNAGQLPRTLITSFQHDAVENAIAKIDTLGLPANRVGGRREDAERRKTIITNWVDSTIAQLDKDIAGLTDPSMFTTVEEIRKLYFAWLEKGKDYEEGVEILRTFSSNDIFEVSSELRAKIGIIIQKKEPRQTIVVSPEEQEINVLLAKQRLTPVAFSDDGVKNLKDLMEQLEFFDLDFNAPDFIQKVINTGGSDEKTFKQYIALIEQLKDKYSPTTKADIAYDIGNIDECIFELITQKENAIVAKIDNINEAKAKILSEYKKCLYSETEEIVKIYSCVQASTCQQTMETGRFATNEPFDLVIVDEAARANPSDLFIPLCLGKKIVLVGDQRQLPHMLDPDTLKELEANTDVETISFYRQSLFERLFDVFEENDKQHFGVKHTCSLTDQYRMVEDISNFVRDKIYLPKVNLVCKTERQPYAIAEYLNKAMVWINVGREHGFESKTRSKYRDAEVNLVFSNLRKIFNSNAEIKDVGIITFYAEQRERIIRKMDSVGLTFEERNKVEVGTIDAFQGKEFDAVIFSCSRCNDLTEDNIQGKVGFLNDENRMCVALSRARNLLIGIGDAETVCNAKILGDYISECQSGRGCYINA